MSKDMRKKTSDEGICFYCKKRVYWYEKDYYTFEKDEPWCPGRKEFEFHDHLPTSIKNYVV